MATLTPAQVRFLERELPSFVDGEWAVTEAGQAGSDRRFLRLSPPEENVPRRSSVLIVWDSHDHDWQRFLRIEREMRDLVPFLPRVYACDEEHGLVLEEDLGDRTLHATCQASNAIDEQVASVYRDVIDALVRWQRVDASLCPTISSRAMDEEMFLWESDYFALHCVTEYFGLESLLDTAWEEQRRELARAASGYEQVCIHRDFQSENILLTDGEVRFVDFQGARLGPAGYDIASVLFDPYATRMSWSTVHELFGYYVSQSGEPIDEQEFHVCAGQRLMQALGAYGNLSLHKGKDWYRQHIPVALTRLREALQCCEGFPSVARVVDACVVGLETRGGDTTGQ